MLTHQSFKWRRHLDDRRIAEGPAGIGAHGYTFQFHTSPDSTALRAQLFDVLDIVAARLRGCQDRARWTAYVSG